MFQLKESAMVTVALLGEKGLQDLIFAILSQPQKYAKISSLWKFVAIQYNYTTYMYLYSVRV